MQSLENVMMNVPLLDLKAEYDMLRGEIEQAVGRVFDSQQFILGPEVRRFEEELALYCGSTKAVGCASGSDALVLALMACGVGLGDEVITTPFTFFATAGAIVRVGARPVFVDIDPDTFNIKAEGIERAVTEKTKAIIPVHLFGQCAEMGPITAVARRRGIAVIEDAAQAIGARYGGRRAGSLGDVATFSFYPSKNLGCAGDGGAVTTSDSDLYDRLIMLRSHGAKKKYHHEIVGINSRLAAIQAAILRVKLDYVDEWASDRRKNALFYGELFRESGLVECGLVKVPHEGDQAFHVYNQYVIRVKSRDNLREYLGRKGISTEIYYPLPLHLQECFSGLGYTKGDFPEAEKASQEALALPIYPKLKRIAQCHVVRTIEKYFNESDNK